MLEKTVLCKWPIRYLQDKLLGICTGDLIMIGAGTGNGKSTISRLITSKAVDDGCPVVLYSLENETGTAVMERVRQMYNREHGTNYGEREFEIWHTKEPTLFEKYRQAIYEQDTRTNSDGLQMLRLHEQVVSLNYGIETLLRSMRAEIAQGYKLFVIDHIDVLITQARDELSQTVENMSKLWEFVSTNGIAVITFSQLGDVNPSVLCPGTDMMRGSRSKGHRATAVITLAKHDYGYYQMPYPDDKAFPTYMRITKFRSGGPSCAVVFFDGMKYLDTYQEVSCDLHGYMIDGMTSERLRKYQAKQKENQ